MRLNNALLKNLLPGLIPLFVFIIAEQIWGLKTGLIVAVLFGIAELVYTFIKTKKIEKFILTDTILLVVLGGISYILDNDLFFKYKPALVEAILALILAVSVFSPKNIVMAMSQRYMKGMTITGDMEKQMNRSLKVLFYITVFHIALIVYSIYYLSNEAWAFISGGLFYILFIGYFAFEFFKNKKISNKYKNEEWLPLVDGEGKIIGKKPRSLCHFNNEKPLHPVIHLHVLNEKKEIYLQKRSMKKDTQPGKWDTAVGGHISFGENLEVALKREAEEEIGLTGFKAQFIKKYVWETEVEKELVYVFITQTRQELISSNDEIDDGRFWPVKEIKKELGRGIFTPNLENEFNTILIPLL